MEHIKHQTLKSINFYKRSRYFICFHNERSSNKSWHAWFITNRKPFKRISYQKILEMVIDLDISFSGT